MTSVTGRIKQIKQPRGGYLPIKQMSVQKYDGADLHPHENTQPSLVGLAVDYLTRVMLGDKPVTAFAPSIHGLADAEGLGMTLSVYPDAMPTDLSGVSIRNAIIFASFDSIFRAGPHTYRPPTLPDKETTENIRRMVERSVTFFTDVYPATANGFDFEGGYTDLVSSGDGDFLTRTGLWDMKVLRGNLTSNHSLQLLMYWRMGLRSIHDVFQDIRTLGFYNPRKNEATTIDIADIPEDVIRIVDTEVIGYPF